MIWLLFLCWYVLIVVRNVGCELKVLGVVVRLELGLIGDFVVGYGDVCVIVVYGCVLQCVMLKLWLCCVSCDMCVSDVVMCVVVLCLFYMRLIVDVLCVVFVVSVWVVVNGLLSIVLLVSVLVQLMKVWCDICFDVDDWMDEDGWW